LIGGTTSLAWSSRSPWTVSFDASGIFAGTQSDFGSPGLKSIGSCILSPGFDRSAIRIASAGLWISNALKSSREFEATIIGNSIAVDRPNGVHSTAFVAESTLLQPSYQIISRAFTPANPNGSGLEASANFPITPFPAVSAFLRPPRPYNSSSDLSASTIRIGSAVILISNSIGGVEPTSAFDGSRILNSVVCDASIGNAITTVIFATEYTFDIGNRPSETHRPLH
jgi:hypothetical protein